MSSEQLEWSRTRDELVSVIKDLHPAGIISSEMAKACKPNRLIFEIALEISGVKPDEAIHIDDSITSDVEPAKEMR